MPATQAPPPRVLITPAAAELLGSLRSRHGPVMFHQSGGCCDGSAPMCYPDGEFIVGDRLRFLTRGRVFTAAELELLAGTALLTGADYERGARPPV